MPASVEVNGPLIEQYRKTRACMSRKRAAQKLGKSEATLYYIERGRDGRHRTQPETLKDIAKLLKVKPEKLTDGVPEAVGVE